MDKHWHPIKGTKNVGWSDRDGDSRPKNDQTTYERTGFNRVKKLDVRYDPLTGKFKR